MIKARKGGLLLIGIEARNVERLKMSQPMVIHTAEVPGNEPITDIAIFYGETFADLVAELKRMGAIPPDMEVPEPKSYKEGPIQ